MTRALLLVFLLSAAPALAAAEAPAATGQAAAAPAQGAAKPAKPAAANGLFGGHNSNEPINVSADAFTGDLNTRVGTYTGNVIVTQGDMKMRADTVRVNVESGKPTHIVADGHIVLTSSSGNATGDSGVYDVGPRTITLTGSVVLTKDKNVMRGTSLVVNLATGQARMVSQGANGNRVQGMFTPQGSTTSTQQKPNGSKGK